ncbi:MAG: DnaA regulatory inactivator Hda [Methylococcales bacterium]|nr:DnaA regulatory inactivator Hda [Methylococcales bacterium]
MSKQIPLQFEFQSAYSFHAFYPGNNQETYTHLQQLFTHNEHQIFLWGSEGSGKSHLLQATCQSANRANKSSFYLSLNAENLRDTSILDGLENIDLVCFDNIDKIAENDLWEMAFFNFFNRHRDNEKHLILSAPCPPKQIPIKLPDLQTRMGWGLTLKLKALSEEQLLNALIYKADILGFELPTHVGKFLILHYIGNLPSMWILLNKIDQETLATQRKLTLPFVKQIIATH